MAARKGESTWPRGQNPKSSAEPPLQIRVDKIVVVEMRIRRINAVDFLLLSNATLDSFAGLPPASNAYENAITRRVIT